MRRLTNGVIGFKLVPKIVAAAGSLLFLFIFHLRNVPIPDDHENNAMVKGGANSA